MDRGLHRLWPLSGKKAPMVCAGFRCFPLGCDPFRTHLAFVATLFRPDNSTDPVRGHFRSRSAPRSTHMHPDKAPRSDPGVPKGRPRRSQAVQNDAKSLSKERPRARQWMCEKHVKTLVFLVFYAPHAARGGPNAKRCTPRFTKGEHRATQER